MDISCIRTRIYPVAEKAESFIVRLNGHPPNECIEVEIVALPRNCRLFKTLREHDATANPLVSHKVSHIDFALDSSYRAAVEVEN